MQVVYAYTYTRSWAGASDDCNPRDSFFVSLRIARSYRVLLLVFFFFFFWPLDIAQKFEGKRRFISLVNSIS